MHHLMSIISCLSPHVYHLMSISQGMLPLHYMWHQQHLFSRIRPGKVHPSYEMMMMMMMMRLSPLRWSCWATCPHVWTAYPSLITGNLRGVQHVLQNQNQNQCHSGWMRSDYLTYLITLLLLHGMAWHYCVDRPSGDRPPCLPIHGCTPQRPPLT